MKRQAEGKKERKRESGGSPDGADLILIDSDDDDEIVYVKSIPNHTTTRWFCSLWVYIILFQIITK